MGALRRRALWSRRLSATPPGLCFVAKKESEKGLCRGTAGTKADFRSMSCWASSLTSLSTLSMCTRSGEWIYAFCSHARPVVAMTTLAFGMADAQVCVARSCGVLAVLASASSLPTRLTKSRACSSSRSREVRSLVIAQPAGFSLWATPIFKFVVMAIHARRNVRDRVLPAPKTPALPRSSALFGGLKPMRAQWI